jgi:hypothetical protein
MIQKFVDRFMEKGPELRAIFAEKHPRSYESIVKAVVSILSEGEYNSIDPERIHEINDGDYQGTLVYVIAASGYQPSTYWYVKVYYGSCSGCDTLEAIRGYDNGPPTKEQVNDYMMLALHIVEGLKEMGDESVA